MRRELEVLYDKLTTGLLITQLAPLTNYSVVAKIGISDCQILSLGRSFKRVPPGYEANPEKSLPLAPVHRSAPETHKGGAAQTHAPGMGLLGTLRSALFEETKRIKVVLIGLGIILLVLVIDALVALETGAECEPWQHPSWQIAFALLTAWCVCLAATWYVNHQRKYVLSPVHVVGTGKPPDLSTLPDGNWHIFLSHVWKTGQDQVMVIKHSLRALLPGVRCAPHRLLQSQAAHTAASANACARGSDSSRAAACGWTWTSWTT